MSINDFYSLFIIIKFASQYKFTLQNLITGWIKDSRIKFLKIDLIYIMTLLINLSINYSYSLVSSLNLGMPLYCFCID